MSSLRWKKEITYKIILYLNKLVVVDLAVYIKLKHDTLGFIEQLKE